MTRHPGLAAIRDSHLGDNGELLPHVLFGDIMRYAASLAQSGRKTTLDSLLDDLDSTLGAGQDDYVENLIWVSFVESAQGVPGDNEESLRAQLPRYPHLAEALTHYE